MLSEDQVLDGIRQAKPLILHLNYREGMSAVFLSQVARPMSLLKQRGYPVALVSCRPLGEYLRPRVRAAWRRRCLTLKREFGLDVKSLPSPPNRTRWLWRESLFLRILLARCARKYDRTIVHCRGAQATSMALRLVGSNPKFRVIFDCRGLHSAELLYVNGFKGFSDAPSVLRAKVKSLEEMERTCAKASHGMLCVSNAMKQYVESNWAVSPRKTTVIPCGTDIEAGRKGAEQRESMRQRLGLTSRFVVAYCGSLAKWQMPVESLKFFKNIANEIPDAHFLGITTQPGRMMEIANSVGIPISQRTIVSVMQSEVPYYLAASDLGLLVREPSVVNHVASPVKFAEYLSSGVPVALTDCVGDYSKWMRQELVGFVYQYGAATQDIVQTVLCFIEKYCDEKDAVRKRCSDLAREYLSYEQNADLLEAVYDEMWMTPYSKTSVARRNEIHGI